MHRQPSVSEEAIADEERRLGKRLPTGLRQRLRSENGGSLSLGDEEFWLHPVVDLSNKRETGRTANSIARETRAATSALEGLLPGGSLVIAENESGDLLVLDASNRGYIWRTNEAWLEAVIVRDWFARTRRTASHRGPSDALRVVATVYPG